MDSPLSSFLCVTLIIKWMKGGWDLGRLETSSPKKDLKSDKDPPERNEEEGAAGQRKVRRETRKPLGEIKKVVKVRSMKESAQPPASSESQSAFSSWSWSGCLMSCFVCFCNRETERSQALLLSLKSVGS